MHSLQHRLSTGSLGMRDGGDLLFQDCASFAGHIDIDIDFCMNRDESTCAAYFNEECTHTGERLRK